MAVFNYVFTVRCKMVSGSCLKETWLWRYAHTHRCKNKELLKFSTGRFKHLMFIHAMFALNLQSLRICSPKAHTKLSHSSLSSRNFSNPSTNEERLTPKAVAIRSTENKVGLNSPRSREETFWKLLPSLTAKSTCDKLFCLRMYFT